VRTRDILQHTQWRSLQGITISEVPICPPLLQFLREFEPIISVVESSRDWSPPTSLSFSFSVAGTIIA
jgi:hypothetical protein